MNRGYLFYSKKDPRSMRLFETIDIPWDKYFFSICVDKKDIRNILKNSKSVKISRVPCLLIINNNGDIVKYEDSEKKELVKMWIQKNILESKSKPQLPNQPIKEPQNILAPKIPSQENPQTPIDDDTGVTKLDDYTPSRQSQSSLGGLQTGIQPGFRTQSTSGDFKSSTPIDMDEHDFKKGSDIPKGIGHGGMGRSSLTDGGFEFPKKAKDEAMKSLLQKAREMQESHQKNLEDNNAMLS